MGEAYINMVKTATNLEIIFLQISKAFNFQ